MDFKIRELINDITQDIIQTYKIQIPIVNINQVVDALGGKVIEDSSLSGYSDGFIRKVDDSFEIVVSPYQPDTRKNFTVAHELGHLFLHMGYGIDDELWNSQDGNQYFRSGNTNKEYQSNEFAAALLMPKHEYKRIMDENTVGNKVDTSKIAEYFNVSSYAASNRGKWLGYLQW
ncbi:TPA: ImmA/IrrE family metallo-endopeptidase [Clostridioides difficile]|nr:ImmA/IrrE family metallo-endopeptidase [Clostridioides difficile]HBF9107763.1 ImmA/IrrE family metallo-endopeptidase [Clostridioides difficile]